MTNEAVNLVAPGEPGSEGHPMTVGQLEQFISKANGDAEVKVHGYTELSPTDVAILNIDKMEKLKANTEEVMPKNGKRINHELADHLKQSLKDNGRTVVKIFEDRKERLFLALDAEGNLWRLTEYNSWVQVEEPGYPDLPRKEVK